MIAGMRHDWDETGSLPIETAHRRHREIARELGFTGVRSESLQANMASVVARAHRQR